MTVFRGLGDESPGDSHGYVPIAVSLGDGKVIAQGWLERRDAAGHWSTVWRKPLVNDVSPVSALVANDGGHVVTFDNWHSMGFGDDAVVIYGPDGAVVRAMALPPLASPSNSGRNIADVALAAGSSLSDILTQMRQKAVAASDASISDKSRAIHNADFIALRDQISGIIANAVFDGQNLLGGPAGTNITFLASTNGSNSLDLPVLDLRLPATPSAIASPAAAMYLGSGTALTTAANSVDAAARVSASLDFLNTELSRLGAASKMFESQKVYFSKLKDS
eukprot:gene9054-12233_t